MVFERENGLTIFDGAIGTEVQKRSPESSENLTDLLNLSNPDIVRAIHQDYLEAGAEFLTTNTFSASEIRLSRSGYEGKSSEINEKGARLAKRAIQDLSGVKTEERLVAGSIGPTGETLFPLGDYTFDQFYNAFHQQARALKNGGADWIIIETMESLRESKAALAAAKEVGLPVISSMSYGEKGRTSFGVVPESGTVTLDRLGADVLGINCGTGPGSYPDTIKTYHEFTGKPLLAEANAGNPVLKNGRAIYDLTPERYIQDIQPGLPYLSGVGSCCGSDSSFTRALARIAPEYNSKPGGNKDEREDFISNNSSVVALSESTDLVEIEIARDELKDLKDKTVKGKINLINLDGIPDSKTEIEKKLSRQFLRLRSKKPIGIVTNNPEILTEFLKAYPGIAPVKTSRNESSINTISKKYGGLLL
ncbi:homocysteine S-methyltransferase family protein [Candidatus Bipolaricaulota bacterium]|nr:homocysteine S-methyltransferase family protein [Candidatus Bipolaricaulota bacterium]